MHAPCVAELSAVGDVRLCAPFLDARRAFRQGDKRIAAVRFAIRILRNHVEKIERRLRRDLDIAVKAAEAILPACDGLALLGVLDNARAALCGARAAVAFDSDEIVPVLIPLERDQLEPSWPQIELVIRPDLAA